MRRHTVVICYGILLVCSCAGVKFVDEAVPKLKTAAEIAGVIPGEFSERIFIRSGVGYLDNFDKLLGLVLYEVPKQGSTCAGERQLSNTFTINLLRDPPACTIAITRPGEVVLDAFVRGGLKVGATYVVGGAGTSLNTGFEVTIADGARALVERSKCLPDDFKAKIGVDKPANACAAYWVDSVALSIVRYKEFIKSGANASVVGTAFGGNGEVWGEQGSATINYKFGVTVRLLESFGTGVNLYSGAPDKRVPGIALGAVPDALERGVIDALPKPSGPTAPP